MSDELRDYQVRYVSDRFPTAVVPARSRDEALGWYVMSGRWDADLATAEPQSPAQPLTVQAAQDSLDKLDQARREATACLQGTEHGDGLTGRVGPLGLVRALVRRVDELTAELEHTRHPTARRGSSNMRDAPMTVLADGQTPRGYRLFTVWVDGAPVRPDVPLDAADAIALFRALLGEAPDRAAVEIRTYEAVQ